MIHLKSFAVPWTALVRWAVKTFRSCKCRILEKEMATHSNILA